jgi:hypothetical protein
LITDNVQNFNQKMIIVLCEKWEFKHLNSFPYRQKINGIAEVANNNMKKIM